MAMPPQTNDDDGIDDNTGKDDDCNADNDRSSNYYRHNSPDNVIPRHNEDRRIF